MRTIVYTLYHHHPFNTTHADEGATNKATMSPWALRVYRWCQQDLHASQVSRAEVAAMIDGDEPMLPHVERVIEKHHLLDALFDALHTGDEDAGAWLGVLVGDLCKMYICVIIIPRLSSQLLYQHTVLQMVQEHRDLVWVAHDQAKEYVAHAAARRGMERVVRWLVENCVQVARQRTSGGELPSVCAAKAGHSNLEELLRPF